LQCLSRKWKLKKPRKKLLKKSEEKTKDKKLTKKKAKKKDNASKPKRVSLPRNIKVEDVDLKFAKKLLSLPREVGIHPEDGSKIVASIGPFGPYLLHNGKYSSVKEDDILEIGLNRAVDLITEFQSKKASKSNKSNFRKKPNKQL